MDELRGYTKVRYKGLKHQPFQLVGDLLYHLRYSHTSIPRSWVIYPFLNVKWYHSLPSPSRYLLWEILITDKSLFGLFFFLLLLFFLNYINNIFSLYCLRSCGSGGKVGYLLFWRLMVQSPLHPGQDLNPKLSPHIRVLSLHMKVRQSALRIE